MPARKKASNYYLGVFQILLAALAWGTGGVLSKLISGSSISPIFSTGVRLLIAAGLILVLSWLKKKPLQKIRTSDYLRFGWYVGVGIVVYNYIYFSAYEYLSVAAVIVIYYTNPILLILYSKFFLQRKIPLMNLLLSFGILLGVFLTLDPSKISSLDPIGVLLAFGAALAFMSYTLIGKKLTDKYSSESLVFFGFSIGGVVLLILAALTGNIPAQVTHNDVKLLLLFGLLPAFTAFLLFNKGLAKVSPTTAAMIASSETIFASVFGVFFLQEYLNSVQIIGVLIVFISIAYKNLNHNKLHVTN